MTDAHESPKQARRAPRRVSWLGGTTALLALLSAGAAYQQYMTGRDRAALPPAGRMVDVGGHMLHLHCSGAGSPTVVLEAGNLAYSATWAWVQEPLSRSTRVCSYDRAGLGWSEDTDAPRDGTTIANQLRRLLQRADERGPFVLVGHSMGALYVRSFALEHPEQTAALVLVDPSHPEQFERWPDALRGQPEWGRRVMSVAPALARVGVLRVTNLFGRLGSELPDREYHSARHFLASPRHLRTAAAELDAFEATGEQLRAGQLAADLPVLVLSASEIAGPPELAAFMAGLHTELARLTDAARREYVQGADHYTILTRADHAADAVRYIEEILRTTSSAGAAEGDDFLEQDAAPRSPEVEP